MFTFAYSHDFVSLQTLSVTLNGFFKRYTPFPTKFPIREFLSEAMIFAVMNAIFTIAQRNLKNSGLHLNKPITNRLLLVNGKRPSSVAFTSARVVASGSLTKSDFSALYIGLKIRATKNQPMGSRRIRVRSFESRLFARQ